MIPFRLSHVLLAWRWCWVVRAIILGFVSTCYYFEFRKTSGHLSAIRITVQKKTEIRLSQIAKKRISISNHICITGYDYILVVPLRGLGVYLRDSCYLEILYLYCTYLFCEGRRQPLLFWVSFRWCRSRTWMREGDTGCGRSGTA
jgi:hypothetical protein